MSPLEAKHVPAVLSPICTAHFCCAVIVRTALIPFSCITKDGVAVLEDEPSILCSDVIPAYRRMRAVGTVLLTFFGAGLPFLFVVILRWYGNEMFYDQLLRVRNEGETALTNPHIYIRRRFRKLYEDYKVSEVTRKQLSWCSRHVNVNCASYGTGYSGQSDLLSTFLE